MYPPTYIILIQPSDGGREQDTNGEDMNLALPVEDVTAVVARVRYNYMYIDRSRSVIDTLIFRIISEVVSREPTSPYQRFAVLESGPGNDPPLAAAAAAAAATTATTTAGRSERQRRTG